MDRCMEVAMMWSLLIRRLTRRNIKIDDLVKTKTRVTTLAPGEFYRGMRIIDIPHMERNGKAE